MSGEDFEVFFNLLYTVYSLPNVVLPFFAGYFVDKYGAAVVSVFLTVALLLGQVVVSLGVVTLSPTIMVLGRVIFGLGGEGLCVAQSTIIAHWFKDRELALAMGVGISVGRGGSEVCEEQEIAGVPATAISFHSKD